MNRFGFLILSLHICLLLELSLRIEEIVQLNFLLFLYLNLCFKTRVFEWNEKACYLKGTILRTSIIHVFEEHKKAYIRAQILITILLKCWFLFLNNQF